jgi:hypothetical protein
MMNDPPLCLTESSVNPGGQEEGEGHEGQPLPATRTPVFRRALHRTALFTGKAPRSRT